MPGRFDRSTERGLLLAHLGAWRRDEVRDFMRLYGIHGLANNKDELLAAVERALEDQRIRNQELIDYLDQIEPQNKQHVVLLEASDAASNNWGTPEEIESQLREANQHQLWQQRLPLAGPDELRLSSVTMHDGVVEIYAVNRKLHLRRREDLDNPDAEREGTSVVEQVYEKVYVRAWSKLRWDTASGAATLHISQLPSNQLYSAVRDDFWDAVRPFFPVDAFAPIDLSKVISRLHEKEESSPPGEARAQAVDYLSHGRRRGAFSSSAGDQGLLGESAAMNSAMKTWRDAGIGHGGNFYFLPGSVTGGPNPLTEEVHVYIVVKDSRVNFPRPTDADDLEYVLSRIRALA